MSSPIEVGDTVRHIGNGRQYRVVRLMSYAGQPHAFIRELVMLPTDASSLVLMASPVPIEHLELVSKGGIQ